VDASGGQSGGASGAGGGSVSGGSAGGGGGRSGGASGIGGDAAGAGGSTAGVAGSGGTAGTGDAAGTCTGCQSLEQCWDGRLCVAKSVSVPAGFAIDATEVTRSQYAAWLATNPVTTGQAAVCSWNASFTPDATCMAKTTVCQGTGCGNHPQPCIDMCDASAYCNAVGKQLCGENNWSTACTSSGVNRFTYGNSLARGMCHDSTDSTDSTTTVPVGTMPGCQSLVPGYVGIFDLIGNVWEWQDNCTGAGGATDICQPDGTSFGMSAAMPECKQSIPVQRAGVTDKIGFRCCTPGASLID
jgi:formylglycine-generating enzyme required for sulfatase activity